MANSAFTPVGGGGGKVLQVEGSALSSIASISVGSGTWYDTGVSVTITPTSTTSDIELAAMLNVGPSAGSMQLYLRFVRGSTPVGVGDASGSRLQATASVYGGASGPAQAINIAYIDSPSTTSAITYKVQIATSSSGTVYVNRGGNDSDSNSNARTICTITAKEIAG